MREVGRRSRQWAEAHLWRQGKVWGAACCGVQKKSVLGMFQYVDPHFFAYLEMPSQSALGYQVLVPSPTLSLT